MSTPKIPAKAKLIAAILYDESNKNELNKCLNEMTLQFGDIDFISEPFNFDYTKYYNKEMGSNLKKIYLSFKPLVQRDFLVSCKLFTNMLEKKFQLLDNRKINIDPGIVTHENMILATNKNFTHRIYLTKGIFSEVTLIYQNKGFQPLNWTFPDYASDEVREIFEKIRKNLIKELKK